MADDVLLPAAGPADVGRGNWPEIPRRLLDFMAIDHENRVVHVEPRKSDDPLVFSFMERCRTARLDARLCLTQLDEIATIRALGGARARAEDADLANREAALALIRRAAKLRASDIHLRMPATYAEVQLRVKGELRVLDRISYAEGEALARSCYQSLATSRDASYKPGEAQNAQISGPVLAGTGLTSIRITRTPSFPADEGGNEMVMRLQYQSVQSAVAGVPAERRGAPIVLAEPRRPEGELVLQQLGFTAVQESLLRRMSEAPNGVIILTGPTGSGKTSTIYDLLSHLGRIRPGKRILSIEDPVEYPMPWAVQLEVTNAGDEAATGEAFKHWLRTSLRMDPDIMLIGECRDADVAIATIQAAQTGHLVYTTLHVTDPFFAVDRLEMMDPVRLNRRIFCNAAVIRGLVAQRLVPRLCVGCSVAMEDQPDAVPEEMRVSLTTYGDLSGIRLRGAGCVQCRGGGVPGVSQVSAVAEVVATTSELMADFVERGTDAARQAHRARPGSDKSLLENAVDRVLAGEVDPRDVSLHVDYLVPRRRQRS